MTAELERDIARRLAEEPLYVRSFHRVASVVDRMLEAGLLERVAPPGGRGRNMIGLTDAGRAHYLGSKRTTVAARASSIEVRTAKRKARLDRFADLLAEEHTITSAANVMGIGSATATGYMRDIRAGLGWQAK